MINFKVQWQVGSEAKASDFRLAWNFIFVAVAYLQKEYCVTAFVNIQLNKK